MKMMRNTPMPKADPQPDPQKIRELGSLFLKAYEEYGSAEVDMGESSIQEHGCGTTACHAGWAFLALLGKVNGPWEMAHGRTRTWKLFNSDGEDMHEKADYDTGTWAIDQFLFGASDGGGAFSGSTLWREWAHEHEELWGNDRGDDMYNDSIAFGKDDAEEITLMEIGNWYIAIADRMGGFVDET